MGSDRGIQFSTSAARRIVESVRAAEATPRDQTGRDRPPPRVDDRRFFELTEELSGGAGSSAACKLLWWNTEDDDFIDSGETGEVFDAMGNAWGLEGERGEARLLGGKWIVTVNPGQPIYEGTADADISATATTAEFSVEIDGDTRTVEAAIHAAAITSGNKYGSGNAAYLACIRGTFTAVSFVECEETA